MSKERFDKWPVILAASTAVARRILRLDDLRAHHVAQHAFDARAGIGEGTVNAEFIPARPSELRQAVRGQAGPRHVGVATELQFTRRPRQECATHGAQHILGRALAPHMRKPRTIC
ncbi:hypothetical protein [Cupriavidus consociatus]|uniref:hypothetical protein n=1 Tax=Cupriavidus consociatus TaxID=2821357 RepID=UPI001AE3E154|nr:MULTISPECIES: hypothetical protein [unclassified Cupriavidus]MBP0623395.1 hypothetical protein [Cupriavidus sp. LEh25]MDK2660093.1 hypothetical protein [Cupriavidus sp. LEh21]